MPRKKILKTGSDEHLYFEAKGIKFKVCGTKKENGYWYAQVRNESTREVKWVDAGLINIKN